MFKKVLLSFGTVAVVVLSGCQDQAALQQLEKSSYQAQGDGIVGGEKINNTHYLSRHTVALLDRVKGSLCTGSIISQSHILTAAHCIAGEPQDVMVVFGYDLNDPEALEEAIVAKVKSARINEVWGTLDDSTMIDVGDIAVLKLEEDIPFGYEPVSFLPDDQPLIDGQEVVLAGFGITSAQTGEGGGTLRTVTTTIDTAVIGKTEVLLDQLLGRGACGGDSGGPGFVVENEGETIYLWGVTSRGTQNCDIKSIYTNAVAYKSWIEAAMIELDLEGVLFAEAQ